MFIRTTIFSFLLSFLIGPLYAQDVQKMLADGKKLFKEGKYPQASMKSDAIIRVKPDCGEAYLLKSKAQYSWDHHQCNRESLMNLDSADKYMKEKYELYIFKSINNICCGNLAKARVYLHLTDSMPEKDLRNVFVRGYLAYNERNFNKAIEVMTSILRKNPDVTLERNARYYLGYSLFYNQKYDLAAKEFLTCQKFDFSPEFALMLARCQHAKKDFKQAIVHHEEAIKLTDDHRTPGRISDYHYYRALTYLEMGNPKKAIKDLIKANEEGKKDADCYYYLGEAYRMLSQGCTALDNYLEAGYQVQANSVTTSFHQSNLYFSLASLHAIEPCYEYDSKFVELAEKHYKHGVSTFDLSALKVIEAQGLIISSDPEKEPIKEICKLATQGKVTKDVELAIHAKKISKIYCGY